MHAYKVLTALLLILGLTLTGCGGDEQIQTEIFRAVLSEANVPGPAKSDFTITLTGDEGVPPVATSATGTALLTIRKASVDYRIELMGAYRVIGAEMQAGAPGEVGDAAATLFAGPRTDSVNGILVDSTIRRDDVQGEDIDGLITAIRDGQAYVNVRTEAHQNGELRGQTAPSGLATFVLGGSAVAYQIDVYFITGITAARIHSGVPGVNGPERVVLYGEPTTGAVNGTLVSGVFSGANVVDTTFDALLTMMRDGAAYVNVSTTDRPSGALRGQIRLQ